MMAGTSLIGWREWVYLPDLGIGPIKAKMDTGARSTALHAYDIHVVDGTVRFNVHTIQGRDDFHIAASAPLVEERVVRDSGGKATMRPIISTTLRLPAGSSKIQMSLVDRTEMSFRMLIGRTALQDCLVSCSQEYLGGVPASIKNWSPA